MHDSKAPQSIPSCWQIVGATEAECQLRDVSFGAPAAGACYKRRLQESCSPPKPKRQRIRHPAAREAENGLLGAAAHLARLGALFALVLTRGLGAGDRREDLGLNGLEQIMVLFEHVDHALAALA